jgi:hypothetical protein
LSILNHQPTSVAQSILAPEPAISFTKTAYGTIEIKSKQHQYLKEQEATR